MIPPGRCAMPTAAGLHARQGRSGVARGLFPAGVAPCATIPPVARTSGNDIAAGRAAWHRPGSQSGRPWPDRRRPHLGLYHSKHV